MITSTSSIEFCLIALRPASHYCLAAQDFLNKVLLAEDAIPPTFSTACAR